MALTLVYTLPKPSKQAFPCSVECSEQESKENPRLAGKSGNQGATKFRNVWICVRSVKMFSRK